MSDEQTEQVGPSIQPATTVPEAPIAPPPKIPLPTAIEMIQSGREPSETKPFRPRETKKSDPSQ